MSLLARSSPRALTLFCIAWLSFAAAQAVNTVLGAWLDPLPAGLGELPARARPLEAPAAPLVLESLARQLGLPLPERSGAPTSVAETGPTPNTLGLKLLGTLRGTTPSATFASIYDGPTRRTRSVWLGSEFRGAQVLAIERTRVLVLNAGRVESIDAGEPTALQETPPRSALAPQTSAIRQVSPNIYELSRQQVTDALAHVDQLATQARIVPSFTNGEGRGFKIFSIRPGSLYEQLGLRNGDVLKRINGLPLAALDQALEAYNRLHESSRLELEVERDGQVIRQHYIIR